MSAPKKYRGMGRYVIGRLDPSHTITDDGLDIYRGANSLEGVRKVRREISHWPSVVVYDQTLGSFVNHLGEPIAPRETS